MSDVATCLACREAPAVDLGGLCGRCRWTVRAEVEEGMAQLHAYLLAWSRFGDWCDERGLEAA
jgi:hypothetical protein